MFLMEYDKIYNNNIKTTLLKLVLIFIMINIIIKNYYFKNKISKNNFSDTYLNNNSNLTGIQYLNILDINYIYSFKYKMVKIEYNIGLFNNHKEVISPSDLLLFYNFKLICYIKIIKKDINIDSMANIYKNKFFKCVEFFCLNEQIEIGIKINQTNNIFFYKKIFFLNQNYFNYNNLKCKEDNIFDPSIITNHYLSLINNFKLKLLNIYKNYPKIALKRYSSIINNEWTFQNIYNNYFCLCIGNNCFITSIPQRCKYYFYTNIIDNNSNIYQKTDYLFIDFIFAQFSPDDTYPIFQEMKKKNQPVHYVTEKSNIYNKYCKHKTKCLTIIPVNMKIYKEFGDFVEKYLILFIKLKAVISCKLSNFSPISSIFYHSEYITYIAVGHGVCYFKPFLYNPNRLYGQNKNNKILLPPTHLIISLAKKHGWKEENIIKINLPRWDKYNINKKTIFSLKKNMIETNSIFIMFTWRNIKINKTISSYYIKNILKLLRNKKLIKKMNEKNVTLYFAVHRYIGKGLYEYVYKSKRKNIKLIKQKDISNCLMKTSLVVSDFSSIIFDLICRKKPIIMYIPDGDEPNLKDIYTKDYYWIIQSLKEGKIYFKNKFFKLNKVIDKIIFYINNDFKLEPNIKKFYKNFGFNSGNNIKMFIKYLKGLK